MMLAKLVVSLSFFLIKPLVRRTVGFYTDFLCRSVGWRVSHILALKTKTFGRIQLIRVLETIFFEKSVIFPSWSSTKSHILCYRIWVMKGPLMSYNKTLIKPVPTLHNIKWSLMRNWKKKEINLILKLESQFSICPSLISTHSTDEYAPLGLYN